MSLVARPNEPFTLRRFGNPGGTGYRWKLELSPGLQLLKEEFVPSAGGLLGAGGSYIWTIVATVCASPQTIVAQYGRPWEDPAMYTLDVIRVDIVC